MRSVHRWLCQLSFICFFKKINVVRSLRLRTAGALITCSCYKSNDSSLLATGTKQPVVRSLWLRTAGHRCQSLVANQMLVASWLHGKIYLISPSCPSRIAYRLMCLLTYQPVSYTHLMRPRRNLKCITTKVLSRSSVR